MSAQVQCAAYTKDRKQCGAHTINLSQSTSYCAIHRNYATNWFSTHPPLHGLFNAEAIETSRVVKEYIEQFKSGAIVPTRAYVYNLPAKSTSYFYYILLCENCPIVNPLWNNNLFKGILSYYFLNALATPTKMDEFGTICNILSKNTKCLIFMYECITYNILKYIIRYTQVIPYIENRMRCIIDGVLELECWNHVDLAEGMTDVIREHRTGLDSYNASGKLETDDYLYLCRILDDVIMPAHQSWRSYVMVAAKSRIEPYVEDLIAAAWHPRRVERWIEVLGIEDVFDVL